MERYTGSEICPKCENTIFSIRYIKATEDSIAYIKLICNSCSYETELEPKDGVN